jgi:uncharacterized delta-60 repeat protein
MKKRGRWLLGSLFVATFVMGAAPVYGSAPGALDNSFGRGGIVQTTFSNIGAGVVLFQSNGDIVVVAANANPTSVAVESIAVIRFLPNGAVDTSFGTQGITIFAFANAPRDYSSTTSAALQSDGKIVVLGLWQHELESSTEDEVGIARLNTNGTLDTTFGQNGLVTLGSIGSASGITTPTALLLQSDGKILVAASVNGCAIGCSAQTAFVRLNPNGTLDSTFGQDGTDVISVYGGSPDILAELTTGDLLTYSRNVIAQYSPSGALRPQVTGGTRLATSTSNSSGDVIQPDGKVLISVTVSGRTYQNFVNQLIRFLPTSDVDWGFQNPPFPSFVGSAVEPDNEDIVVVAQAPPSFTAIKLLRFNPDGSVDTSFGNGGTVLTSIAGGSASPNLVAIQPNGSILVAGSFTPSGSQTSVMILARYLHLAH